MFDEIADKYPDNDAIVAIQPGKRYTYRELQRSLTQSKGFIALGLKGDRLAIWYNLAEWIVTSSPHCRPQHKCMSEHQPPIEPMNLSNACASQRPRHCCSRTASELLIAVQVLTRYALRPGPGPGRIPPERLPFPEDGCHHPWRKAAGHAHGMMS